MRISQLIILIVGLALVARAGLVGAQAVAQKETVVAPVPVAVEKQKKEPAPVPVAVEKGKVALTPKNTTIQFVGTHVGAEPNPRTGYFTKFKGELAIDEATKAPKATSVEIETKSLITPISKLTNHLQTPDFFDIRKYPKATFKSTKIEAVDAAAGKYKVTGELTIRDQKRPITFPADVKVTDAGAVLTSTFKLKRSEFGMNFGPEKVVDTVAMTVTVGKATPKVEME
jgi:polyisoprenoid-binding protein YceI